MVCTKMSMNINTVSKVLVDEIEDIMADEIQKEIDFDILASMLVGCGWTRVDLPPFDSRYHAIDISIWVEDNCGERAEFKQFGRTYVFKDPKDATAFALKWL